jgi:hypothetical protein
VTSIDLNLQADAVQEFFRSLPADPQGAVVELNGRAVARVLPVRAAGADDGVWTDGKNERRCLLIDREITGSLTPEEAEELARLQQEMLAYRRRVAPLPLDDARRLHQELLTKAGRCNGGA